MKITIPSDDILVLAEIIKATKEIPTTTTIGRYQIAEDLYGSKNVTFEAPLSEEVQRQWIKWHHDEINNIIAGLDIRFKRQGQ